MPHPTVSIDRSLGHFVSEFALDFDAIETFYDQIEDERKPPLEACHIHFSSLVLHDRNVVKFGRYFRPEQRDVRAVDPLAPTTTDVLILVGSILRCGKAESFITECVTHELGHYAKSHKPRERLSQEEILLAVEMRFRRNGVIPLCKHLGLSLLTVAVSLVLHQWLFSSRSPWTSLVATLLIVNIMLGIKWHRHAKERLDRVEKRLIELSHASHSEVEADHLTAKDGLVLCWVTQREKTPDWLIRRPYGKSILTKMTDVAHRHMSLSGPR